MTPNESNTSSDSTERGEIARKKLIQAGLKIYSEVGYEKASTRMLAAEAGVNIAAIPYYFGNKEGHYVAVIDSIIAYYQQALGDDLKNIRAALANPATTTSAFIALFDHYLVTMVRFVLQETVERDQISRIYTREQLDPTPAFGRLYSGFVHNLHETLSELVGRILGTHISVTEAKLITHTLLGQVTIFKSSCKAIQSNLGWDRYGPERIADIERLVLFQIHTLIHAYQQHPSYS